MIGSVLVALLGSLVGGGVRAGVVVVEQRLGMVESTDAPIVVSGSIVGALAGGILADVLGRGPRLAFWLGALLGAAGSDRFDWAILRRMGIDPDRLVAQARQAATAKGARGRARRGARA